MRTNLVSGLHRACCLLPILALIAACTPPPPAKRLKAPTWYPARVALAPYDRITTQNDETSVRSPLTGSVYVPGPIALYAEDTLNRALSESIQKYTDLRLAYSSDVSKALGRLRKTKPGLPARRMAMELGRAVGADAVLVGYVYRFQSREGGPYAAGRPSSVAFDLALVRTRDGRVLWKDSFVRTQKALSDNLLDLREYRRYGLRWLTASELAIMGMDQVISDFPWRRPQAPAKVKSPKK